MLFRLLWDFFLQDLCFGLFRGGLFPGDRLLIELLLHDGDILQRFIIFAAELGVSYFERLDFLQFKFYPRFGRDYLSFNSPL